MSDLIDAIIQTRKTAAEIFEKSLTNIEGLSEVEFAEKVLAEANNYAQVFPEGYYSPPPGGVGIIFDQKPFDRLKYDSLRDQKYWPNKSKFQKETVGMIYSSFVDRGTGMLGDVGCTIYRGKDEETKKHIKKSYEMLLSIAQHTKVGMSFREICSFAADAIKDKFEITVWVTRSSDPTGMNLGHTVPGSYDNLDLGKSFEEIKNTITKKRIFIKESMDFKIPETCAFTIESRFEGIGKESLPSTFFHFIVTFDNGKKNILTNFKKIFEVLGMDYMYAK